jgi:hypothetical protein
MVDELSRSVDEEAFTFDHVPVHRRLQNGFAVEGFAAIELMATDAPVEPAGRETVHEAVLERERYRWGQRGDSTVRVFDSVQEAFFDIALELPDIVIYPRASTTTSSLQDVVQLILDYEPRYSVQAVENSVSGRNI